MHILRPHSQYLNGEWYASVPVRNKGICEQQLFLNSLPSEFSLATAILSNNEDPFDKKWRWKELGIA